MWKSTAFAVVFAVPVFTNAQCDSCDGSVGNAPADPQVSAACASYPGQASLSALGESPRVMTSVEQWAIDLDGTFVADQARYDRLSRDLVKLWIENPAVDEVFYRPAHDPHRLVIWADDATLAAIEDGSYTAWDCANEWYGLEQIEVTSEYAFLDFDATMDIEALAEEYEDFPGMGYTESYALAGDGSTVCATPDGSDMHYLFDLAAGDCPAGCIDHTYVYHRVEADGTVHWGGHWSEGSGESEPAWLDDYWCF